MLKFFADKKENSSSGPNLENVPSGMMESEEEMLYRLFNVRKKTMTPSEKEYLKRSNEISGEPA